MIFTIKQDNTSPYIAATLKDANSNAVDLTGATVVFNMADLNGTNVVNGGACTITDEEGGGVSYAWQSTDTQNAGSFQAEFKVTYTGGDVESFPNNDYIIVNIVSDLV